MYKKVIILSFLLISVLQSCSNQRDVDLIAQNEIDSLKRLSNKYKFEAGSFKSVNNSLEAKIKSLEYKNYVLTDSLSKINTQDNFFEIELNGFTLGISNYEILDNGLDNLLITDSLTAVVSNLGIEPFNEIFKLSNCTWNDLKIHWRYETSITISDDGAHLDLLDWKHYLSDWKLMERIDVDKWRMDDISDVDRSKFPNVSKKEIRNRVEKERNKKWINIWNRSYSDDTLDVKNLVGLSSIYVKVQGVSKGGKIEQRILKIEILMGC